MLTKKIRSELKKETLTARRNHKNNRSILLNLINSNSTVLIDVLKICQFTECRRRLDGDAEETLLDEKYRNLCIPDSEEIDPVYFEKVNLKHFTALATGHFPNRKEKSSKASLSLGSSSICR